MQRGQQSARTTGGALLGATVGALVVAAFDLRAVVAGSGGLRTLVAALAAAFLLASIGAVVALCIVMAARGAVAGLARVGIEWSSALCALVLATFSVFGAQELVLVVLNGNGIRTAAVSLSAAVGVAAGVALAAGARAVARRLGVSLSFRARTACVVAASVSTLVLVVVFAPGLMQELDVTGLSSAAAPVGFALLFALVGIERKNPVRAAIVTWIALATFGVGHIAVKLPGRAARLIAAETHASRFVFGTLLPPSKPQLVPLRPGRGTCYPGVGQRSAGNVRVDAKQGAPDIIFVTVDAMRWDHTTLGGYGRDTTPALARWAASAAVFSSAMTPASSTRQTFRALFSGVYPSQVLPSENVSWWGVSFAPAQRTLAHHMSEAGFLTVSVTDGGDAFDAKSGALAGFERRLKSVSVKGPRGKKRESRARSQIDSILQEARAVRDKPLFAWAHIMTPHQPYVVSTDPPYGDGDVELYDWALKFVDGELDRLLRSLDEDGRLARTFVIVSADHGQAFHEHGNRHHGQNIYQEQTHVPLLIWGPGVRPGKRIEPVSTLDLFPTILELAGTASPPSACGTSIASWLRNPAQAAARDVYMEQVPDKRPYFQVGFVRGYHKLVVTPHEEAHEVFNLRVDPHERNDVAKEDPRLTEELIDALIAFQRMRGMDPASYGLH